MGIVRAGTVEQMPRLVPDHKLPRYAYIPGQSPHPTRDPSGHHFKLNEIRDDLFIQDQWENCIAYLLGFDLFNLGYYWESHESWESLWHAVGRKGNKAVFLQGLIKLAASGVKAKQGSITGLNKHADGAIKLFREVGLGIKDEGENYYGFKLKSLIEVAEEVKAINLEKSVRTDLKNPCVFEFILLPDSIN